MHCMGYGWGLQQEHGQRNVLIGFWSQLWKGAEYRYSLIEKQLSAMCASLIATEPLMGKQEVQVQTIYPIARWIHMWAKQPRSGSAQTPTLTKWGAYLEQRARYTTSPLAAELQQVLGPVKFVAPALQTLPHQGVDSTPSALHEGKGPPLGDARYTDGSCKGSLPTWVAVALQPATEAFWYETGEGQSSQWAELQVVWTALMYEPSPLQICMDSWAVH